MQTVVCGCKTDQNYKEQLERRSRENWDHYYITLSRTRAHNVVVVSARLPDPRHYCLAFPVTQHVVLCYMRTVRSSYRMWQDSALEWWSYCHRGSLAATALRGRRSADLCYVHVWGCVAGTDPQVCTDNVASLPLKCDGNRHPPACSASVTDQSAAVSHLPK